MIFRRLLMILLRILGCFTLVVIYNEFIIYYVTLAQCNWPSTVQTDHVKAVIVADIHMLGPFRGHWADKLRREWQMHRAYQTSMTLFRPDVVFILGDLFDEGQWVDGKQFQEYVERYRRLFYTDPQKTRVFGALGNHDIGFHYASSPRLINRFKNVFNNTDDTVLVTVKDVHFVLINSVRMEGDGCHLCHEAVKKVENISSTLKCAQGLIQCKNRESIGAYSRPVLLQHFPTYRPTDLNCLESDSEDFETYRERWEVLSMESTKWLGKMLNPRVAFSGHSHNYCRVRNMLDIEEYTISSYSWRNKNNPKFLLALFTPNDYHVAVCALPKESTVFYVYAVGFIVSVLLVLYVEFRPRNSYEHYTKLQGKLS